MQREDLLSSIFSICPFKIYVVQASIILSFFWFEWFSKLYIYVNNGEIIKNNKSDFIKIEQSKNYKKILSNYYKYSKYNLEKYHTPMINENTICNNYINLNFNNN